MSCHGNNATPPGPAIAPGSEEIDPRRAAEEIVQRRAGAGADRRVIDLVPAFDAPFFQAGLCGYSDAAMRIVARRLGCPFCVTEALLDRTLLAGGRGFAKADLGELHDNVPGGDEDQPLAGQIMGSDPREMAAAATKMVEQCVRPAGEYRRLAYAVPGVLPSTSAANGALTAPTRSPVPTAASAAHAPDSLRIHLRLPGGEQIGWYDPLEHLDAPSAREVSSPPASRAGFPSTPLRGPLPIAPSPSFAAIDINLACPVKKIDRKARGGHWLAEPEGAIAILEAVREAVPAGVLCTVKLRRAYDETPEMAANFERVFDAAYRIGFAWTTVHARTVRQAYVGPSRWTFLRDLVARHPDRIVFGSGDVWHAADIVRMIAYTGVSGVSVARGCIGNPWLFRQARALFQGGTPRPPTIREQREVLEQHFGLSLRVNSLHASTPGRQRHAEAFTGRHMRKFGIRFAAHHPRAEQVRARFVAVESLADWRAVLDEFYVADGEAASPPRSGSTASVQPAGAAATHSV